MRFHRLLFGCVLALLASCAEGTRPEPRPNLVLICADTLRSDHLGVNGYARETSPHLDALARGGANFERSFSTYPQTAASVASIFSSLYPSAHKVSEHKLILSSAPPLLAETLLQAGYRTAAVATNPHLTPGLGFERGFERFLYIHGRNQERSSYETPGGPPQAGVEFRQSKGSYYGRGDDVNQAALEWLDQGASEQPFYLYLHYMDVHSPYVSPEPFQDRFVQAEGRNVYQNGLPKGRPSLANQEFTRARYDGGIAYLDHVFGELQAGLAERGLIQNTYLVFTADHGDEFMEHGGFGHGETLYREMTQVPLFISGPGLSARTIQAPVSGVDLFPTLCELLGVPAPAGLQGASLAPLMQGTQLPGGSVLTRSLSEGLETRGRDGERRSRLALFDERWHLIYYPEGRQGELYDYLADPAEAQDLWDTAPKEAQRLAERALGLRNQAQKLGIGIQAQQAILGAGTEAALQELGYGGKDEDEEDDDSSEQR